MRRWTKIAAVTVAATLVLAGCGKNDKKSESSGLILNCDAAKGDGPKIGLAYDVGGQGDKSFNDAAARGSKKAVEQYSATCVEAQAITGEPESAREDRLRQLADAGANPIICAGFSYSEAADKVSGDYPDVTFGVVDGFDPTAKTPNKNVAYLGFAENEGSFLVGVAAAEKTKAKHVGFVGGVHVDLIKKFEAGFIAGVHAVDPSIKVVVKYIEESNLSGFNDPAGGKAAADGLYQSGADIVYHAAGASGEGVFDAAVEAGDGKWAIGVDSDQYLSATPAQQKHILTSMLKRVDVASFDLIKSIVDGKPLSGYQTYDLKADGVSYSTSGGFIDDITGDIDAYAAKIKSGKIKVPTTP